MRGKKENFDSCLILQQDFCVLLKKKKKKKIKNTNRDSQTAKLVYAKLAFVSPVVMRFTHQRSLRT